MSYPGLPTMLLSYFGWVSTADSTAPFSSRSKILALLLSYFG